MAVESTQQIAPAGVERWRFTVDDFYRMGEVGILPPEARVELIDGEVIKMAPIGSGHSGSVEYLGHRLRQGIGDAAFVRTQNPIRLGLRLEPEPDLSIVRPRADFYRRGHPTPSDVFLVVEVADSTLTYDRDTKGPRYARAGIIEYWIVDLANDRLLVHRGPADGAYQSVEILTREDAVCPLDFPELTIAVADILG
jgi:Uma2 family endonuclease